jgi:hypothetical protein
MIKKSKSELKTVMSILWMKFQKCLKNAFCELIFYLKTFKLKKLKHEVL